MNGKSISILVVNAEPAEAEAIGRKLQAAGLDGELRVAGSLCEYRELVAAASPDLVLIDLILPDGRAENVLIFPSEAGLFPVVVLVPAGQLATAAALIEAGATDCLIKSIEALAALPICVSRVLREWDLRLAHRLDEKRLEQAQQHRGSIATLAAGIAHDLSNALAPISMTIQLMQETGGVIEGPALGTIQAGAQRATDIVRQLVSLSDTSPGGRLLFQPRHLVKETEQRIRAMFPNSIQLTNYCPKDLWLIMADPVRFQGVLLTLSLCAREAMPNGGRLALSAANVELDAISANRLEGAKPGRFVCLEVRHTSRSLPPAAAKRIYDSACGASGPEGNGTEQGLAAALGSCRDHGGFMVVDGEGEQGLALQAFFPAATNTKTGKPGSPARGQTHSTGQTVLVVDDEPLLRNTITNVLRRLGFDVLSAADGVEALGLCARHLADLQLVLTDLDLPHMGGLTLIRSVRQMKSSIAVIVMAGGCGEEQRAELATLNVTAVLAKPFSQEELLEVLRLWLPAASLPADCLSTCAV